jgi:hypothetical protein
MAGNISPSYAMINPSRVLPELIVTMAQKSGAWSLLADSAPVQLLGEGDLYAYIRTLDIRTRATAAQAAANMLPSLAMNSGIIGTPTYLCRSRFEFDHHDTAAAGRDGYSLDQAARLGMRQGITLQLRNMLLIGLNPTKGEGLLNQPGITLTNLPPDSAGNTTFQRYDNGEFAFWLLSLISAAKSRMFQLGMPGRIAICAPQRILGPLEWQDIVSLAQFQAAGGGTMSAAGLTDSVANGNGDWIDWVYDDSLQGKGAGGTDALVLTIPEIKIPEGGGMNTSAFSDIVPNMTATTLMLCDMAAPREIPTPMPGGAIDIVSELRASCGWAPRPEAVTVASIPYQ